MKPKYKLAVNYQFVSIPILATLPKYYFPDLPNLRGGVCIQRINTYFSNTLNWDTAKVPCLPLTVNSYAYLTLNKGSDEIFKQLDLSYLHAFQTNSTFYNNSGSLFFDNVIVDFSKSFIEINTAVAPPLSICFGVFYIKTNQIN